MIEELFKSLGIGFYKNPSKEEMSIIAAWSRAIGTKSQNLYVAEKANSKSFHADLEDATWKLDKSAPEWKHDIVEVQRVAKTNLFALGEQHSDKEYSLSPQVKKILRDIRKKNKHLVFTTNNIMQYDLPAGKSGWPKIELQDQKDELGPPK